MKRAENSNGRALAGFIATARERSLPPQVLDAARLCLADWVGVALGARAEAAARIVREMAAAWNSAGRSTVLFAANAAAPVAALANGTLAHCLDFDDTHVKSVAHISAPVWAATLAAGEDVGAGEAALLSAFVHGYEVASRAGYGLGEAVTARGWHGTGVFGRLGAAAAAAVLLELDAGRALHALGAAATQTSGLTASFGTMAKPFHAGKGAMDGILAAQLAARGFEAATGLLEPGGAFGRALIQDGSVTFRAAEFNGWEILHNSFKPYAACHLTHPAIDAARTLARDMDPGTVRTVHAEVGALAKQVTGGKTGAPTSSLDAKFDLNYCIALALHGSKVSAADFLEPWNADDAVVATARKVRVDAKPDLGFASARLRIEMSDGADLTAHTAVAKGHPGNPMTWDDMQAKFAALVTPVLGDRTGALFDLLRRFGQGATWGEVQEVLRAAR